MIKKLWKRFGPNPLDKILRQAIKNGHKTILIPWNRGMGDIALGLYAIVHRIRSFIPDARITFLTRNDLKEAFQLLDNVETLIDPEMQRASPYTISPHAPYDLILENADPSHWVSWQRGTLIPKMRWKQEWDSLHERFHLPNNCIAAHVSCETNYYFERNWPKEKWQELFEKIDRPILLFGFKKEPAFHSPHLIDLRGETSLLEALSIIKHNASYLIAPDSGILGLTYFLDTSFPLKVISLWADPNHGILKQNVASPNSLLSHIPIISPNRKNADLIKTEEVLKALC